MACTALGTTTPVLGLCKPGDLEAVDWAPAINSNWDLIDAAIGAISGGSTIANGAWACRGLLGQNDDGSPNTVYGFAADLVVLRFPSTNVTAVTVSPAVVVNMSVNGANGLDTGAMVANTWYHFYFIRHPTGPVIAGLASLVAPITGPALPSGYTSWAYAGAVRSDASTHLILTFMRGAWCMYGAHQALVTAGAPAATVETNVSLSALVPPNALTYATDQWFVVTNSAVSGISLALRAKTLLDAELLRGIVAVVATSGVASGSALMANLDNTLKYVWATDSGTPSSPSVNIFIKGYRLSNGDA